MQTLEGDTWTRQGTAWLWSGERLAQVCSPSEVWSLRQFLQRAAEPDLVLPSNTGRAVVVAGLDSMLDALGPAATDWFGAEFKRALHAFSTASSSERALVFWLANGTQSASASPIDDTYSLTMRPAGAVPLKRLLAGAEQGITRLVSRDTKPLNAQGDNWHGLYLRRAS